MTRRFASKSTTSFVLTALEAVRRDQKPAESVRLARSSVSVGSTGPAIGRKGTLITLHGACTGMPGHNFISRADEPAPTDPGRHKLSPLQFCVVVSEATRSVAPSAEGRSSPAS